MTLPPRPACAQPRPGVAAAMATASRNTYSVRGVMSASRLLHRLELLGIDLGVQTESIEGGLLRRVRANRAAQAEWQLQALDVAVIGKVEAVFHRRLLGLLPQRLHVLGVLILLGLRCASPWRRRPSDHHGPGADGGRRRDRKS